MGWSDAGGELGVLEGEVGVRRWMRCGSRGDARPWRGGHCVRRPVPERPTARIAGMERVTLRRGQERADAARSARLRYVGSLEMPTADGSTDDDSFFESESKP